MKAEVIGTMIDESNPRQINLIKQRELLAQRLLGERYDGVYDFFCDVLEDDSTYKILRARRCQVLLELFIQIIMFREKTLRVHGTFLSSDALENHLDTLRSDSVSVLIIDDVLIHGRGIKQLYEQLDQTYSRNQVRIMVYCRALSANYIDEKLEERFNKNYLPAFDYEWRNISCSFVDLIVASVIPYESFAGSLESFIQASWIKTNPKFDIIENFESALTSAYVLFEKDPVPIFFQSVAYDMCLRVYTSRPLNAAAYVPYVFVKNITSDIPQLFEFVSSKLARDRFAYTITALLKKNEKLRAYQMRLFSALVNRIYGVYLQNKYGILDGARPSHMNMELCFGHEIAEELLSTQYADILGLLNECPPYVSGAVEEDPDLDGWLKIYEQDSKNIYQFLSMYYYINGRYDEVSAKKRMARKAGLSMACFYEKVNPSLRHQLTAAQLRCWDYGQASGVIKEDVSGAIALFGIAGEQNFRFIIQENRDFFRNLNTQYSLSFVDAREKWDADSILTQLKRYVELIENDQTLSEGMKSFQSANRRMLEYFLLNNLSNLPEWFIPQVLS